MLSLVGNEILADHGCTYAFIMAHGELPPGKDMRRYHPRNFITTLMFLLTHLLHTGPVSVDCLDICDSNCTRDSVNCPYKPGSSR